MPTYDVKITGYAANVTAANPEDAIKQIRDYAGLYSTFTVLDSMSGNPVPVDNQAQMDGRFVRLPNASDKE
jgi:hypothetical protein